MAVEQRLFQEAPPKQRRSRSGVKLDPNWDFIRVYSTGALLGLIETLKDEFNHRGCRLTVEVGKVGAPDQDVVG